MLSFLMFNLTYISFLSSFRRIFLSIFSFPAAAAFVTRLFCARLTRKYDLSKCRDLLHNTAILKTCFQIHNVLHVNVLQMSRKLVPSILSPPCAVDSRAGCILERILYFTLQLIKVRKTTIREISYVRRITYRILGRICALRCCKIWRIHDLAHPPIFTDLYWHSIIGNNIGGYFLGEDRKFFSPLGTGHELHFHASFGIVLVTIIKAAVSREGYFLLSLLRVVVID